MKGPVHCRIKRENCHTFLPKKLARRLQIQTISRLIRWALQKGNIMKFAKQLIALAAVAAAFSAHAESDINSGVGALNAVAKLDFRVIVPKVLFLQVGTVTAFNDVTTVDRVDFTLTAAQATSGAAVAGVSTGGTINARVLGNGGNVTFGAVGSVGGLTNGVQTIPWSDIVPTATGGTLIHPSISGAPSSLAATAGVVNQNTVYTFNYSNTSVVAAGTYNGQVLYTASVL